MLNGASVNICVFVAAKKVYLFSSDSLYIRSEAHMTNEHKRLLIVCLLNKDTDTHDDDDEERILH